MPFPICVSQLTTAPSSGHRRVQGIEPRAVHSLVSAVRLVEKGRDGREWTAVYVLSRRQPSSPESNSDMVERVHVARCHMQRLRLFSVSPSILLQLQQAAILPASILLIRVMHDLTDDTLVRLLPEIGPTRRFWPSSRGGKPEQDRLAARSMMDESRYKTPHVLARDTVMLCGWRPGLLPETLCGVHCLSCCFLSKAMFSGHCIPARKETISDRASAW